MNGQAASGRLRDYLFSSAFPEVGGDRRRQAAVVVWIVAAVCFAIGFGPAGSSFSHPTAYIAPIAFSITWWLREALREGRRGARAAIAVATARVGTFWILILGIMVFALLVGLVAPDDVAWFAGWWIGTAALALLGGFVYQRERRQPLAVLGLFVGLLVAVGSLAGYAVGGDATVATVIGVPVGLAIFYLSGRRLA